MDDAADDARRTGHLPLEPAHPFAIRGPAHEGRRRRFSARSLRGPPLRRQGRPRRPSRRACGARGLAATLYLDVGGRSLHERGWRAHAGAAPLRETMAAAVLRLSGWDRKSPLVDPMCGAGTIAIEAAAWARRMAPGLGQQRLGFERWASHDDGMRRRVELLRAEARAAALPDGPPVYASDVDPRAVELTQKNARAAGVDLQVDRSRYPRPGRRSGSARMRRHQSAVRRAARGRPGSLRPHGARRPPNARAYRRHPGRESRHRTGHGSRPRPLVDPPQTARSNAASSCTPSDESASGERLKNRARDPRSREREMAHRERMRQKREEVSNALRLIPSSSPSSLPVSLLFLDADEGDAR